MPKRFFMIIVNISLKEIDEFQRWKAFIAIWIASGVILKSQWAGEWGYIFSPHACAGEWGCDESALAFTFVINYSLKSASVNKIQTEWLFFSNTHMTYRSPFNSYSKGYEWIVQVAFTTADLIWL